MLAASQVSIVDQRPALAQININIPRAARHVKDSLSHAGFRDQGLLIKTILAETFGGLVAKPWRIHSMAGGDAIILAYTQVDLAARQSLALPSLQSSTELFTSPLPALTAGQALRFSIRLVPTVRTESGERDAFLVVKESPDCNYNRAQTYEEYFIKRLAGASVRQLQLDGFSLREVVRPMRNNAKQPWRAFIVPTAEISGVLTVENPADFMTTLLTGIGRQRAYGYGYLRLEPIVF